MKVCPMTFGKLNINNLTMMYLRMASKRPPDQLFPLKLKAVKLGINKYGPLPSNLEAVRSSSRSNNGDKFTEPTNKMP